MTMKTEDKRISQFHYSCQPCAAWPAPHRCEDCARAFYSDTQGANQLALALEQAKVPCWVANSGGDCMLVQVYFADGTIVGVNEECIVKYANADDCEGELLTSFDAKPSTKRVVETVKNLSVDWSKVITLDTYSKNFPC